MKLYPLKEEIDPLPAVSGDIVVIETGLEDLRDYYAWLLSQPPECSVKIEES